MRDHVIDIYTGETYTVKDAWGPVVAADVNYARVAALVPGLPPEDKLLIADAGDPISEKD